MSGGRSRLWFSCTAGARPTPPSTARGSSTSRAGAAPWCTRATRTRSCSLPRRRSATCWLRCGAPSRAPACGRTRWWSPATRRAARWRPTTRRSREPQVSPRRGRSSPPTLAGACLASRTGCPRSRRAGSRRAPGSSPWPAARTASSARGPRASWSAAPPARTRGSCSSTTRRRTTTRGRSAPTRPPGAPSGRRWTGWLPRSGEPAGQQRRADRAAEVPERREADRGRALGGEQVRLHGHAQPLRVGLAELQAEAAADHDGVHVENVDRRGHAGAERPERAVDELVREIVVALERPLPDPARQAWPTTLLHDLEQRGLAALLDELARPQLHRAAACVGLHAAAPPARASRAADLDHDVADLTRGAAARPRLGVQDDPAADARAPEDAEQRAELAGRAELELGVRGDVDVVADRDGRPERVLQRPAEREAALPVGQVARRGAAAAPPVEAPRWAAATAAGSPWSPAASRSAPAIA